MDMCPDVCACVSSHQKEVTGGERPGTCVLEWNTHLKEQTQLRAGRRSTREKTPKNILIRNLKNFKN